MYHVSVGRGRCARQIPSASHSLGTSPCFKGRLAARKSLRALRTCRWIFVEFVHESSVDTRSDRGYTESRRILREAWTDASGKAHVLVPLYDNEDNVCGIDYNDVPYFFMKNLQGDSIAITDNNGTVVARYTYDAWGVCKNIEDETDCNIASLNPFRYRSYYHDIETNLYYLQSRYYDPEVGRFINADDAMLIAMCKPSHMSNLFSYCTNNPINYTDQR